MRRVHYLFLLLFLVKIAVVKGQQKPILLNMDVQIEATEAVNSIYNFDFIAADKEFRWLRYKYSKHPLPYFLLGFAEWWKLVPNPDVKIYDKNRCKRQSEKQRRKKSVC